MSEWYNYRTGQYEERVGNDFSDYIPQIPAAQGLYKVHLAQGKSPLDAAKETLLACLPEQYRQAKASFLSVVESVEE